MRERGTERHRETEELEEPLADESHRRVPRRGVVAQQRHIEWRRPERGAGKHRSTRLVDARELGGGDESGRDAAVRIPRLQCDQFGGIVERQRPQQRCVHGAEDRRRRADADGERRGRGEGEGRGGDQLPDGVAEILGESSNLENVGPSSTDWFDPAAREAAVRKQYMAMVELQYDEHQLLLPLYRKYLPLIAAAMGHTEG